MHLIAMAISLAVSNPTPNGSVPDLDDSVARRFNILGVKLGMSPEQVSEKVSKAGFKANPSNHVLDPDSWQTALDRKIAERRPNYTFREITVPRFTMARGNRGEIFEAWYSATPSGAKVSGISMTIPTDQMSRETFVAGVLAKYGEPVTRGYGKDMLYCSEEEQECKAFGQVYQMSILNAQSEYSSHRISLRAGEGFKEELRTLFESSLEAQAPRDAKPTF